MKKLFAFLMIVIMGLFLISCIPQYKLTITIEPQEAATAGCDIEYISNPQNDNGTYNSGSVITFKLIEAVDWEFDEFEGGDVSGSGTDVNPYSFTVVSDASLTVKFVEKLVEEFVYVSKTGNDETGTGESTTPYLTIQKGINEADTSTTKSGVKVAEGTYNESLVMIEGVSIYGGYDEATWERDIVANETIVSDPAIGDGTSTVPNRAIYCPNTLTRTTVIDGFTINGNDGNYSNGILVDGGSPTISNNKISGGATGYSNGIANVNASTPLIINNYIVGGTGTSIKGIFNQGADENNFTYAVIINNIILAGTATNNSYGIFDYLSCSSKIINNIVEGGISPNARAIASTDGGATIINNIIFCLGTTGNRYGIYEVGADSDPVAANNNNIYDCPTALYRDSGSSPANLLTITEVNAVPECNNNVSEDPLFVSGTDYHFSATSPTSVTQGGLDMSTETEFPEDDDNDKIDKDGNKRTAPWSIGAYEKD